MACTSSVGRKLEYVGEMGRKKGGREGRREGGKERRVRWGMLKVHVGRESEQLPASTLMQPPATCTMYLCSFSLYPCVNRIVR